MFLQRRERKGSVTRSAVSDSDADLVSLGAGVKESLWCAGRPGGSTSGGRGSMLHRVSSVEAPERAYVFQELLKERSGLWDRMEFWEDVFYDAVTHERDLTGLDQKPGEMLERYSTLDSAEQKRLREEEDRLLAIILQNVIAFMVMMDVNHDKIRQKVRRLLGKCHISLAYGADVNDVLDQLDQLYGNSLRLKPLTSKQVLRQTFTVRFGVDAAETTRFLEVREDGLMVRAANGTTVGRYSFERIVSITYCPTNNVLCLWHQSGSEMQLHKYYTSKCKKLYHCIKGAMDNAIGRDELRKPLSALGGEFPIEDMQTGEGGILQVWVDGIGLLFENSKFFVRVENIYKCDHTDEGVFVLEEYIPKTKKIVERKYRSKMAYDIFCAVLCVFSYLAAGPPAKTPSAAVGSAPAASDRAATPLPPLLPPSSSASRPFQQPTAMVIPRTTAVDVPFAARTTDAIANACSASTTIAATPPGATAPMASTQPAQAASERAIVTVSGAALPKPPLPPAKPPLPPTCRPALQAPAVAAEVARDSQQGAHLPDQQQKQQPSQEQNHLYQQQQPHLRQKQQQRQQQPHKQQHQKPQQQQQQQQHEHQQRLQQQYSHHQTQQQQHQELHEELRESEADKHRSEPPSTATPALNHEVSESNVNGLGGFTRSQRQYPSTNPFA